MASSCTVTIAASSMMLPTSPRPRSDGGAAAIWRCDDTCIETEVHPRLRRKIDRFSQLALVTTAQLKDCFADADKRRVGVFIGNDFAGWNHVHDQLVQLIETRDPMAIDPYVATAWFPAAAQGEISIAHGILGQSKTFAGGFLSGGLALEYAARMVAGKTLDIALAGGIEAPDAPAVLLGLTAGRRISAAHVAAEAAALIALCPDMRTGRARMVMSSLRRRAEAALGDVAECFAGTAALRYHSPSVAPENRPWNEALLAIETKLRAEFGARIEIVPPPWNGADVGSASFPLAVLEGARAAEQGVPSLVFGSDFDGLFLASAILPGAEGAR